MESIIVSFILVNTVMFAGCAPGLAQCPSAVSRMYGTISTTIYEQKCWQFVNMRKNWNRAMSHCMLLDGALIKIDSEQKSSRLEDLLTEISQIGDEAWMGLNDQQDEQVYQWATKNFNDYQPVDWTNWAPHDQQKDVIELLWANCGKVTRAANWAWSMEICENEYTFICEYDALTTTASEEAVATPAPQKSPRSTSRPRQNIIDTAIAGDDDGDDDVLQYLYPAETQRNDQYIPSLARSAQGEDRPDHFKRPSHQTSVVAILSIIVVAVVVIAIFILMKGVYHG